MNGDAFNVGVGSIDISQEKGRGLRFYQVAPGVDLLKCLLGTDLPKGVDNSLVPFLSGLLSAQGRRRQP